MNRRDLIVSTLLMYPAFAVSSVLAASPDAGLSRRWVNRHDALAAGLRDGSVDVEEWRRAVASVGENTDPEALLWALRAGGKRYRGRAIATYPAKTDIRFRDADGRPRSLRLAVALFSFRATDVITPHGHSNMVSAHMVVDGAFRVRTFDKLGDEPDALILRPSADTELALGAVSSIGVERDNVHWFVPTTETAATVDVIVSGLDETLPSHAIDAVHPEAGTRLSGGLLRAPKLGFEEAASFYTNAV